MESLERQLHALQQRRADDALDAATGGRADAFASQDLATALRALCTDAAQLVRTAAAGGEGAAIVRSRSASPARSGTEARLQAHGERACEVVIAAEALAEVRRAPGRVSLLQWRLQSFC